MEQKGKKNDLLQKQKRIMLAGSLLCLCLLLLPLPKRAGIALLDVGQGDGIYIRTSDGTDVFIDGGSSDVKGLGIYRILPFLKSQGIGSIDYWFLSHLDQDHISGFFEAVESGCRIRQVVLAKGVLRDEAYEKLIALLAAHQIKVCCLDRGERLCGKKACFTALAPDGDNTANDRNAGSLVLLYEDGGFTGFFPGDISKEEEAGLMENGSLPQTVLYKAAHHGSNYSNSKELLKQLSPAVSVVSCAKKNDYGHPGKEAAAHMEAESGRVYYTMDSGRIWLRWDKGRLWAEEFVAGRTEQGNIKKY